MAFLAHFLLVPSPLVAALCPSCFWAAIRGDTSFSKMPWLQACSVALSRALPAPASFAFGFITCVFGRKYGILIDTKVSVFLLVFLGEEALPGAEFTRLHHNERAAL